VVWKVVYMTDDKESSTDKVKKALSFKIHGPKNPFKRNPFKKKDE